MIGQSDSGGSSIGSVAAGLPGSLLRRWPRGSLDYGRGMLIRILGWAFIVLAAVSAVLFSGRLVEGKTDQLRLPVIVFLSCLVLAPLCFRELRRRKRS